MTTSDWLGWRRQGIGASDVAGVLGISPWASPWSVWADKAGLLPPLPDSEAMAAGRWLEAAIGPWFAAETGLHVAGEQTWCSHLEHDHHRCTVDGFVLDGPARDDEGVEVPHPLVAEFANLDSALGLLEVKVTGPGRRWEQIPPHYQAQGQWQMHVTGLDRVWFAVLMGRRLDIHVLDRDQADIDYMVAAVDAFWTGHVLTGTPPPTDGHDATLAAIAAVHPEPIEGQAVELDGEVVEQWRTAKRAEADAKAETKRHAAALTAALGDAEQGTVDGRPAVTWRAQTRTTTCKHCGHTETSDPYRVLRAAKS